jgi:AcrR family transcriptional regulator
MVHVSEQQTVLPGQRKRMPAMERRAQILAISKELFAREGIEETSMRKIAARAGVSPAVLYQHFADKDALLFALTEAFFDILNGYMERALAGAQGPVERLAAIMKAYLTCGIRHPHEYRLTFMTALPRLRRGQEMKEFRMHARLGEPSPLPPTRGMICFGMLEAAIADVVREGLASIDDVAVLTETVWASGHGLVSLVITHDDFDWSARDALIEASIGLMLKGLLKR